VRSCPGPSVEELDETPGGDPYPLVEGVADPPVLLADESVDPVAMACQDLQGSVGGSTVHDDVFDSGMVLTKDAPDGPFNGPC
jgi:hypothetical protein